MARLVADPQFAVWSGGLACLAGVAALVWRVPELWRAEADGGGGLPTPSRYGEDDPAGPEPVPDPRSPTP